MWRNLLADMVDVLLRVGEDVAWLLQQRLGQADAGVEGVGPAVQPALAQPCTEHCSHVSPPGERVRQETLFLSRLICSNKTEHGCRSNAELVQIWRPALF